VIQVILTRAYRLSIEPNGCTPMPLEQPSRLLSRNDSKTVQFAHQLFTREGSIIVRFREQLAHHFVQTICVDWKAIQFNSLTQVCVISTILVPRLALAILDRSNASSNSQHPRAT